MNIEIKFKWMLFRLLCTNRRELIQLEASVNPTLRAEAVSDRLRALDRIYQNLFNGLGSFPGQAFNDLRSFPQPSAMLTSDFVMGRIARLRSLIQPFAAEVGFDIATGSKNYPRLLLYFLSAHIILSSGVVIFITSSLVSIFSADIREYLLKTFINNQVQLEDKENSNLKKK